MKSKNIIAGLFLYLASTGASFAMFNVFLPQSQALVDYPVEVNENGDLVIDPGEPKTETCPLNGQKFTKTERSIWETKRPLAVMIENSVDSRPQSGLGSADIVYETVAEGGVTRFMLMLYCDAVSQDTLLAPIRSARTYFVDWASEYNRPIYTHVGGANCSADSGSSVCKSDTKVQAIEQIQKYGWRLANDVDGMSVGLPVFYRDYNRLGKDKQLATEHTMTTSSDRLWTEASKRKWTSTDPEGEEWSAEFEPWEFQDEASQGGESQLISYEFWDGYKQYDVQWNYDPSTNSYLRTMGGTPHVDLLDNKQLAVKNVIVIKTKETGPVDDLKHMLYETIGKGDALLFRDGQVEEVRWSKPSRTDRTIFTDKTGKEVKLTRGKIWISIIDISNEVAY